MATAQRVLTFIFFFFLTSITFAVLPKILPELRIYALTDCVPAGSGICDSVWGSQRPGNEVCGARIVDQRIYCSQTGSGETPSYACCRADPTPTPTPTRTPTPTITSIP